MHYVAEPTVEFNLARDYLYGLKSSCRVEARGAQALLDASQRFSYLSAIGGTVHPSSPTHAKCNLVQLILLNSARSTSR